jgi:hypothetical protein
MASLFCAAEGDHSGSSRATGLDFLVLLHQGKRTLIKVTVVEDSKLLILWFFSIKWHIPTAASGGKEL